MDPQNQMEGVQGIPVIKETRYSAFMLSVDEGNVGPIRGAWISFTEPTGHRHSFFCAGQTVADLRMQLAAAGYSGIETVGEMPH